VPDPSVLQEVSVPVSRSVAAAPSRATALRCGLKGR
jgi:hypothetical protein